MSTGISFRAGIGTALMGSTTTRRTHLHPERAVVCGDTRSLLRKNGEPPGTRTPNPQIKSLLPYVCMAFKRIECS